MINISVYVVSTLLTYAMGILNKQKGWEVPIPIQNIVVGIICFISGLIFQFITNEPVELNSLVEQIVSALGGAGTATLYYDTNKSMKEV